MSNRKHVPVGIVRLTVRPLVMAVWDVLYYWQRMPLIARNCWKR